MRALSFVLYASFLLPFTGAAGRDDDHPHGARRKITPPAFFKSMSLPRRHASGDFARHLEDAAWKPLGKRFLINEDEIHTRLSGRPRTPSPSTAEPLYQNAFYRIDPIYENIDGGDEWGDAEDRPGNDSVCANVSPTVGAAPFPYDGPCLLFLSKLLSEDGLIALVHAWRNPHLNHAAINFLLADLKIYGPDCVISTLLQEGRQKGEERTLVNALNHLVGYDALMPRTSGEDLPHFLWTYDVYEKKNPSLVAYKKVAFLYALSFLKDTSVLQAKGYDNLEDFWRHKLLEDPKSPAVKHLAEGAKRFYRFLSRDHREEKEPSLLWSAEGRIDVKVDQGEIDEHQRQTKNLGRWEALKTRRLIHGFDPNFTSSETAQKAFQMPRGDRCATIIKRIEKVPDALLAAWMEELHLYGQRSVVSFLEDRYERYQVTRKTV